MNNWSATQVDAANYCKRRYYLRYVLHEPDEYLSVFLRGTVLHDLVENFWKKLGKKYDNSESFAEHGRKQFWRNVIVAEKGERKVSWRFEGERYEFQRSIERTCLNFFSTAIEEGPPIFSELGFNVSLGNRSFKGRIDEIRRIGDKIVIRDYKSGFPLIDYVKSHKDMQLALYNAALNALIMYNSSISDKLGFSSEERKILKERGSYINPDFEMQFFMFGALDDRKRERQQVIYPSNRKESDFSTLLQMIKSTEQAVLSGNVVPEWGRKCADCGVKYACIKRAEAEALLPNVDQKGQMMFEFASPKVVQKTKQEVKLEQKMAAKQQTRLRLRRSLKVKDSQELF
ncbi:MAG: PD-(D/E)XK nuclease family protein [Nanoarchaeota archaeon]